MRSKRFRLIAGLAGTTLCLFAISGYTQNTNTPATTDAAGTPSVAAPQGGTAGTAQGATQTPTTTGGATVTGAETRTTGTTTTTTSTSFPGGVLGILAVAVLILLVLFALFRGRDRTVVRETSTSSSAATPRTSGTASSDAASARAASGPGTSSSMNDPNARR